MSLWSDDTAGLVVLPDGRQVRGRGLRNSLPAGDETPEFGLYLTGRPYEANEWESRWVRWPDFRLPHNPADAVAAILDAHDRAATQRVEVACDGGIGRTGTTIALLARLAGISAAEAVAWTRANYRPDAVETPWQRRFVATTALPGRS
ncbi:MAG: protein-tyrosine phosphatase family protein [Microlunatus sp.]